MESVRQEAMYIPWQIRDVLFRVQAALSESVRELTYEVVMRFEIQASLIP
jgi:hypothetical protein